MPKAITKQKATTSRKFELPVLLLKPTDVQRMLNIDIREVRKLMDSKYGIKSFKQGKSGRLITTVAEVERFVNECVAGNIRIDGMIHPNQNTVLHKAKVYPNEKFKKSA